MHIPETRPNPGKAKFEEWISAQVQNSNAKDYGNGLKIVTVMPDARFSGTTHWWVIPFEVNSNKYWDLIDCAGSLEIPIRK